MIIIADPVTRRKHSSTSAAVINLGEFRLMRGSQVAQSGFAPAEMYTGPWTNIHQGLTGGYKDVLAAYWQHMVEHLESDNHDYKMHQLPLARIKKVMKADPEVKMISAEAPILFAKGCDIFITELTMRAWIHAEENKRRTLQRSDIASALAKSDMFDFLIDIVPREEANTHAKRTAAAQAGQPGANPAQMPPGVPGAQNHSLPGPDYGLGGHGMPGEPDYRQPANMYMPVQPGAPGYAQPPPQMYNAEDMYYQPMPSQHVGHPRLPHLGPDLVALTPRQSA
jgi:nuclear transcription factor Y, gamma